MRKGWILHRGQPDQWIESFFKIEDATKRRTGGEPSVHRVHLSFQAKLRESAEG